MVGDERVSGSMMLAKRVRRARLVRPHQPRVVRHIGGKDRGETAFDGLLHGLP